MNVYTLNAEGPTPCSNLAARSQAVRLIIFKLQIAPLFSPWKEIQTIGDTNEIAVPLLRHHHLYLTLKILQLLKKTSNLKFSASESDRQGLLEIW